MAVQLRAIEIQNLRGFVRATVSLERDVTLLVGGNNSGKTSMLLLLDWVLNRASERTLLVMIR